jgi:hypothetical protein
LRHITSDDVRRAKKGITNAKMLSEAAVVSRVVVATV